MKFNLVDYENWFYLEHNKNDTLSAGNLMKLYQQKVEN